MNTLRVSLGIVFASVFGAAFASDPSALMGKPMPNITMSRVGGGKIAVGSLKGKVVILDFWATWCAPCVAASPTMQSLFAKYAKQGLVVIGADMDSGDSVGKSAGYAKKHGYTYPFTANNLDIAAKLGVASLPVFMFIDRKGVVQRVDTGFAAGSAESWDKTIQKILK